MEGAQDRTHVRGNLFSFGMAWEDVYRCCLEVENTHWRTTGKTSSAKDLPTNSSPTGLSQTAAEARHGLPHGEETLASLVRVCIRGGSKDLSQPLEGITMRPFVVLQLIRLLRSSGYPGYASNGIKSDSNIERRMGERYTDKYEGHVKFIPDAIFNIVDARKLQ